MKLKLVKIKDEAANTKSFFFTPSENFTWQAGQYAYLTLGDITKQFTIASSPTEEFVQITTRIRKESEFKQLIDKVQIGEEIEARAPFGTFTMSNYNDQSTNYIFLAGGIGITPFRSMIKYNVDKNLKIPMYLIYSNSDNEFVFKMELDQWQKENEFIKVYYHDSSVSGHLDKNILNSLLSPYYILHTTYYSVGPAAFVNSVEDSLEQLNIESDMIRTEKFIGY